MLGRVCSIFVVLVLQGPSLSVAYQVATENEQTRKYIDASSVKLGDDDSQSIVFDVKSCEKIFIYIFDTKSSEMYNITLRSGAYNSFLTACRLSDCQMMQTRKLDLEFCNDFASFWVSCSRSEIKVGTGCELDKDTFLKSTHSKVFAIQNATVSSREAASWRFGESSACEAKTTQSATTDSAQESTSSGNDYQSSTVTAEETKSEVTTRLPKDKVGSSAPMGTSVQAWVIISMAVFTFM